ncbi:succinate dehydrogenase [Enhygromyxa salina]|uniref:Succinate dehydrogenase n=1 Tax=Enhygromyxa salina TaxID=215803 RepID=A0A2S9YKJ4_9BACT|nr:succinate dehydrogenase [Enhygromyxa salina]PRQ05572.1 hypothetical protein ENSA7_44620 [Enhygromyxa salina]
MPTHLPVLSGYPTGRAASLRKDAWWQAPIATVVVLSAFIIYATWAAFQGEYYWADPYLSPFYSPAVFIDSSAAGAAPIGGFHGWFGEWPSWWPAFLPASPAFFILAFPGMFRGTCYYYRKAYYRSFAGSPPGCAVNPIPTSKYLGETRLLVFQNLHRYALYLAIPFIFFLSYDAIAAFSKDGQFGIGVGTIVLTINAVLLACYTFGCHSFRHLVAGHDDCMSCGQDTVKYSAFKQISWLNERHQLFAWMSLFWVGFADVYVRLVSMGVITDLNTWS